MRSYWTTENFRLNIRRVDLARCLIFLTLMACKPGAPDPAAAPPEPPAPKKRGPDYKNAFTHQVRYDRASQAVVVDLKVAPGFHAYTVGETIGKPLAVQLDDTTPYEHAGPVRYPKGKTKNLPIGRSVIVEGEAQIVAPIRPKPGASGNATGVLRYQICTDDACDRPRKVPFTVEAGPT